MAALADVVELRARGVVVATDADAAGRSSAERAFELLTPYGVNPRRAGLPTGSDPAELYAKAGGAELTAALLDRGRPLIEAIVDDRIESLNRPLRWIEERVSVLQNVAPLVASLPVDDIRPQVGRLSRQLDLDVMTVQREIASHIGKPYRPRSTGSAARVPASPLLAPRPPRISAAAVPQTRRSHR